MALFLSGVAFALAPSAIAFGLLLWRDRKYVVEEYPSSVVPLHPPHWGTIPADREAGREGTRWRLI
jgi:hypothetical protein